MEPGGSMPHVLNDFKIVSVVYVFGISVFEEKYYFFVRNVNQGFYFYVVAGYSRASSRSDKQGGQTREIF